MYLTSTDIKYLLTKYADEPVGGSNVPPPTDAKEQTPPAILTDAPPEDPMAMPKGPADLAAPQESPDEQMQLLEHTLIQLIGEGLEASASADDGGSVLPEGDPWYAMQQEGLSRVAPEEISNMMWPNNGPALHGRTSYPQDPSETYYEKTADETVNNIIAFQNGELPLSRANSLYILLTELLDDRQNRRDLIMPILADAWAKGLEYFDQDTLAGVHEALAHSLRNPGAFPGS